MARSSIADAPQGHERVQVFSSAGHLLQQFLLPGLARTRVTIDGFAASGVAGAALHRCLGAHLPAGVGRTDHGVLAAWPTAENLRSAARDRSRERGSRRASRAQRRPALVAPDGGYFFVFQAGRPAFRKYDAQGRLQFERQVQGREIDGVVASQPDRWPRGVDEQAMIPPTVRAAAVDQRGQLWIALSVPYTYVFDADGDKLRVVQLRAGGVLSPSSLTFGPDGRLLTTPGLAIFDPVDVSKRPVDTTILEPITLRPQSSSGGNR